MDIEKIFNEEFTLYLLKHGWPNLSESKHIDLFESMIPRVYARSQQLGYGYRKTLRLLRSMHLADNFTGRYICFLSLSQRGVELKNQILKEIE
ncbi:hypothetical protein UFOVP389_18 [uncultured Caudovirales phage]|uniref:Uncharacterized protein n=1 Tax=uncultured Caudovirales phage TaxID=2100421 RepID=A0A6J7X0B0_9CAUD|nr:hypothetical protein UFOVP389_18 [uncultured Caudovirales phage]